MNRLPQFFDWRGELGRHAYLRKIIQRILILIAVGAVNIIFSALMGLELDSLAWFEDQGGLFTAAALVLFIPIDIRRMNDIGINLWWLVVFELLSLLPYPASGSPQHTPYLILVVVPQIFWALFLLLKPGKEYREYRRQKV